MFTSCFLMRCSSKSSGPSKFCRRTGYASRMDSNSCSIKGLLVRELHGRADALDGLARRDPRLLRALVQDFLHCAGPGEHGGAARADGIEMGVEGAGQFGLDLDVAHLAGAV